MKLTLLAAFMLSVSAPLFAANELVVVSSESTAIARVHEALGLQRPRNWWVRCWRSLVNVGRSSEQRQLRELQSFLSNRGDDGEPSQRWRDLYLATLFLLDDGETKPLQKWLNSNLPRLKIGEVTGPRTESSIAGGIYGETWDEFQQSASADLYLIRGDENPDNRKYLLAINVSRLSRGVVIDLAYDASNFEVLYLVGNRSMLSSPVLKEILEVAAKPDFDSGSAATSVYREFEKIGLTGTLQFVFDRMSANYSIRGLHYYRDATTSIEDPPGRSFRSNAPSPRLAQIALRWTLLLADLVGVHREKLPAPSAPPALPTIGME